MYILAYLCVCTQVCGMSLYFPAFAPEVFPLVAGKSLGTITPNCIPRSQSLERNGSSVTQVCD